MLLVRPHPTNLSQLLFFGDQRHQQLLMGSQQLEEAHLATPAHPGRFYHQ
jgi:hypothetical protein